MNLQQFIEESICEICEGIEGANRRLTNKGVDALVNPANTHPVENNHQCYGIWQSDQPLYPMVHMVKFNVAVFAKEGSETKGGIGIMVAAIGIGAKGASSQSAGSESRLEFGIPVLLPRGVKS